MIDIRKSDLMDEINALRSELDRQKKSKLNTPPDQANPIYKSQFNEYAEKYQLLFEHMHEGFALHKSIFDKEGKPVDFIFLEVNKAFEKLIGLPTDKIINHKATDIIPGIEKSEPNIIEEYGKVALNGSNTSFDVYLDAFDRWYTLRVFTLKKGISLTFYNDITEQKKSITKVDERKKYVDQLIDALPGLFYQINIDGDFIRWNKNFETISGYSTDEISKMDPYDLFESDDKTNIRENIHKVFTVGKASVEANLISKNGSKTPFLFSGKKVEIDEGTFLIGMGLDISTRNKVISDLMESELKFKSLLKSLSLPLALVDNSGNMVYINDRFTKDLGYTLDDIPTIDEWWIKAYPDETYRKWVLETWDEAVEKARIEGNDIESVEYNVRCKNGQIRILIIAGITIKDGILATLIDVTERKKAENELIKTNAELEKFNKLAVGRELTMIELKKKINQLNVELGNDTVYDLSFTKEVKL